MICLSVSFSLIKKVLSVALVFRAEVWMSCFAVYWAVHLIGIVWFSAIKWNFIDLCLCHSVFYCVLIFCSTHLVFGRVVSGQGVVVQIHGAMLNSGYTVKVNNCGELKTRALGTFCFTALIRITCSSSSSLYLYLEITFANWFMKAKTMKSLAWLFIAHFLYKEDVISKDYVSAEVELFFDRI